jgi:hypothetical protein
MAKINLEQAYTAKQQSGQRVTTDRKALDDLQQQVQSASEALAADTDRDTKNAQVLAQVGATVPPDKITRTADGTILVTFMGQVHAYPPDEQVDASTITFDDGQGDTPPDVTPPGDVTPPPDVTPAPGPAPDTNPTPAPEPAPEPIPFPTPEPAPVVAPEPVAPPPADVNVPPPGPSPDDSTFFPAGT